MWSLDYIISIITYYSLILLLFKWTFALFRHYLFISFYYVFYCVKKLFGESLCYFEENHCTENTACLCAYLVCVWC